MGAIGAGQRIAAVDVSARQVLDQVIAGEYAVALQIFNHHAVISAKKGAPVKWILMEPATGVLSVVSIPKFAPHPNAAKLFEAFLVSKEGQKAYQAAAYLPAVTGYYSDVAGNMLSFPFNASTPILYYNKDVFRAAGLDPDVAPKTWPEVGAAAKRLRAAGAVCGLTTSWPSWINVENFSAFHNLPLATRGNGFAGLDAELTFNNPIVVRHVAQLAEWQTTKVFDYSGRGQSAEPRFQKGECGIFIGSSATRADIKANSKFEVGYGMMPNGPTPRAAESIIGAPRVRCCATACAEYVGAAKFFAFLEARPGGQPRTPTICRSRRV